MTEYRVWRPSPLFADRRAGGRALAARLERERGPELVVVGLARGGVEVAAEVARTLAAPLDVVAVRKIRAPFQPEYALGAVTPDGGVYVRGGDALTEDEVAAGVEMAKAEARALDRRLHAEHPLLDLDGNSVLVVDDGLATGATMIAALRWARAAGAGRVIAAVPVAAADTLEVVRAEADDTACVYALEGFIAVGVWYASFAQLDDEDVIRLVEANRMTQSVPAEPLPS